MSIAKGYTANFKTLATAFEENDVCLLECTDRATGKPVVVICATEWHGDECQFIPFAKMFDGNPYDELDPPHTGGIQ